MGSLLTTAERTNGTFADESMRMNFHGMTEVNVVGAATK